jgi:hypothetical protein
MTPPQALGEGAVTWSLRAPSGATLPEGIDVDPLSGLLTGTPGATARGTHRLLLVAAGAGGEDVHPLDLEIDCPRWGLKVGCGSAAAPGVALWGGWLSGLWLLGRRSRRSRGLHRD